MNRQRNIVLITAATVVVGILIGREHAAAGMWVVLAALSVYLILCFKHTVQTIKRFRISGLASQMAVVTKILMLMVIAAISIGGPQASIPYFPLLLIFCADLMLAK